MIKDEKRNYNIDVIKAISICMILVWHIQPLNFIELNNELLYFILNRSVRTFNFEISLLAVPSFFFISLYLFYHNNRNNYFRKRIIRLLEIFLFWMLIQIGLFFMFNKTIPELNYDLIKNGGPGLPYIGGSVFYYCYLLIVLTILSNLFLKCNEKSKVFIGASVLIFSVLFFEIALIPKKCPIDYSDISNFLYIIPLAYFFYKKKFIFIKYRYLFLILFLIFVTQDFLVRYFWLDKLPTYGRLSIVFGMLSFVCFIMNRSFQKNNWIYLLSVYSLGIFALHKYFQMIFLIMIPKMDVNFFEVGINIQSILIFITSVIMTFLSIYLLQYIGLNRYIR